jgi:hypothetical protein
MRKLSIPSFQLDRYARARKQLSSSEGQPRDRVIFETLRSAPQQTREYLQQFRGAERFL